MGSSDRAARECARRLVQRCRGLAAPRLKRLRSYGPGRGAGSEPVTRAQASTGPRPKQGRRRSQGLAGGLQAALKLHVLATSHALGRLALRFGRRQRIDGRRIENAAIDGEVRAMAGAVPADFERIPVQVAAKVGAGGRALIEHAVLAPVGGNFPESVANDGALARLQLVDGTDLARRRIFGKIFDRSRVLGDEVDGGRNRNARRLVELLPRDRKSVV